MGFIGAKLSDNEIIDWLKTKENQSATIKEALKEKRLREIGLGVVEIEPTLSSFRLKRVIK